MNMQYIARMARRGITARSGRSAGGNELLAQVGMSLRHWRGERGLSRQALATASGVSPRFLAQIESGTGNVSLRRLADLARALDVTLVQLLTTAPATAGPRVALLGLRGAGKSTVGPALARRLGVEFLELDGLIEASAGMSIGQVFELHGERYFRRLERETLARLLGEGRPAVIATGGGLVTDAETYRLLREGCTTVWLSALPEEHYQRVLAQGDRRPMRDNPDAMAELKALLASREPLYRQADLAVDTSRLAVGQAVAAIAAQVPRAGSPPAAGGGA